MVLEWLKGATGVFSAGDRGAARSPAQARPPARRVRIQEDAKAAAAARVTREKEKARKDTPRKKNQESPRFRPGRDLSRAPVPFRRVECVPKDTVAVRPF